MMLNGWVETRTYVDDGFSGGNFQRPGFLDMLEDARKGIINLILVKDLSRLGRDYVEVGRYTDIVFPSLGCRFVSVLDCLDSEGDNTDMLHFRSLMNDYHLRDLSTKIKSVIHNKKINGQYLGSMAPFGYAKSAEDSHRLVIDEYAAGIVRRIFDMRLSGTAYSRIVASLNRENIPSPRFYWYQNHSGDTGKVKRMWTTAMVKIILNNEVYCGILRMNYKGTRSYKDRTMVAKREAEWIRHEGLHEAIVSPEVWNTVQKLNDETRRRFENRQPPCPKLFSGKLVCADCKSSLATITSKHRLRNGCEHLLYLRHGQNAGIRPPEGTGDHAKAAQAGGQAGAPLPDRYRHSPGAGLRRRYRADRRSRLLVLGGQSPVRRGGLPSDLWHRFDRHQKTYGNGGEGLRH